MSAADVGTLRGALVAGESPRRRLPVLPVTALLQAQQTLTAVERFAKEHDSGGLPAKRYTDLLPLERPRPGEQYAFDVDLDACTGCKACVAACHSLNGLDELEIWRTVGALHGGTVEAPALQTITSSCHHCLEPACLQGCPVQAYEKDPITGIVHHLDDQCFGCQYCTLMCPYDAPKYSKKRGVVRKCDMCSDRLAHGEAPACVQACPNQAISIRVVDQSAVVEASDAQSFLPGTPAPDHTLPTTRYRTKRSMPNNMLPADFYRTSPEHSHPPLVIMLTLTQLSVGAFVMGLLVEALAGHPSGSPLVQAAFAGTLAVVALGASVFHLGRPWLAWRAFLGFRTSWLSREAIAFGGFAQLAACYGFMAAAPLLPAFPGASLMTAAAPQVRVWAALVGTVGVFCSVMVYVATRRAQWSGTETGLRFFGTTVILGAAAVLTVCSLTTAGSAPGHPAQRPILWLVLSATVIKLIFEARIFGHLGDKGHSALKRMAILMSGQLRVATSLRFGLAIAGGVALPLVLVHGAIGKARWPACLTLMLGLLVCSELCERYLFFRAAPASRMPGGIP